MATCDGHCFDRMGIGLTCGTWKVGVVVCYSSAATPAW